LPDKQIIIIIIIIIIIMMAIYARVPVKSIFKIYDQLLKSMAILD